MSLSDADREHIRRLVDEAPPLTAEQKAKLRIILAPIAKRRAAA